MKILGIETSCDETAVCLLEGSDTAADACEFTLLGNALHSQIATHAPYGGVYPNLAKREHARNLVPLLHAMLRDAGELKESRSAPPDIEQLLAREPDLYEQLTAFLSSYAKPTIDALAVTAGPGLEPALWVGVNFAKALSLAWGIPIVAVNHMEGHLLAGMLAQKGEHFQYATPSYPLLALLISGGHTELILSRDPMRYELVGQTRDDAAGEAFDKVARLLELPYPGGPQISALARTAREAGRPTTFKLPRPMLHEENLDFSFSGLKTAVRRHIEGRVLTDDEKMDLAREFEDAVTEVLVEKTLRAVDTYGAHTVLVGGGVAANENIRRVLAQRLSDVGTRLLEPPPSLTTDNAVMIALAGYFHALRRDYVDPANLRAEGNLKLAEPC